MIQGTYKVELHEGKYHWGVEQGSLFLSGGPYSTQLTAVLGMLYALSVMLIEPPKGKEVANGKEQQSSTSGN